MKTLHKLATSVCALSLVAACSKEPSAEPMSEAQKKDQQMQRVTIVSDAQPGQTIPAFNTYSFVDKVNVVIDDPRIDTKQVQQEVRDAIALVMQAKGYSYEPKSENADLVMGFLFSLESGLADADLTRLFGMSAGVVGIGSEGRYEKATLVLGVMSPNTEQLLWKSMVQGFADFEKPKQDKTGRADAVVGKMLENLPQAGQ
ncbi:DUF4136 domain-containing protein [Motilimonas pumila]|uniref:DUF4136 domain-containing protein n=1 Tax=Motilimonas pumila TaxID=2303987 RepID=A0A418YKU8_9GAMM|nr:DUF4136 domain-containing protein [Motilimonas pumila]RJG51594.1 DUF4136 domain-containing protein [Motilimonas pumila]